MRMLCGEPNFFCSVFVRVNLIEIHYRASSIRVECKLVLSIFFLFLVRRKLRRLECIATYLASLVVDGNPKVSFVFAKVLNVQHPAAHKDVPRLSKWRKVPF